MMGNQDISLMWKIFNILKILMRYLYLVFSPLMLVKSLLVMKVTNMLQKEVKSQITVHALQCVLTFQYIDSKG